MPSWFVICGGEVWVDAEQQESGGSRLLLSIIFRSYCRCPFLVADFCPNLSLSS